MLTNGKTLEFKNSYAADLFMEAETDIKDSININDNQVDVLKFKAGILELYNALREEYKQQTLKKSVSIAFSNKANVQKFLASIENVSGTVLLQEERLMPTLDSVQSEQAAAAATNGSGESMSDYLKGLTTSYSDPNKALQEIIPKLSTEEFNALALEAKTDNTQKDVTLKQTGELTTLEYMKFNGRMAEDPDFDTYLTQAGIKRSKIKITEADVYLYLSYKAKKTKDQNNALASLGVSPDEIAAKSKAEAQYKEVKDKGLLPSSILTANDLDHPTAQAIYMHANGPNSGEFFTDTLKGIKNKSVKPVYKLIADYFDYLLSLPTLGTLPVAQTGKLLAAGTGFVLESGEEKVRDKYNKIALLHKDDFIAAYGLSSGYNSLARKRLKQLMLKDLPYLQSHNYLKADGSGPIDDLQEVNVNMLYEFLIYQMNKLEMPKLQQKYNDLVKVGKLPNKAYDPNTVLVDIATLAKTDAGFSALNLPIDDKEAESVMQYLDYLNGTLKVKAAPPPPPPPPPPPGF